MRKLIIPVLLVSLSLLIFSPVKAQAPDGAAQSQNQGQGQAQAPNQMLVSEAATPAAQINKRDRIEQLKAQIEERKELINQKLNDKRTTAATRLKERKRDQIRYYFNRLTKRLEAAVTRLETLIFRIDSRLAKIETEDPGLDISSAESALTDAKLKLASASADIAVAKTSLDTILESDDLQEAFSDVRDLVKEIKQLLIEVHRGLVHIIGDIKGLRTGQDGATLQTSPEAEPVASPAPEASLNI
jgi:TolA-binding protein